MPSAAVYGSKAKLLLSGWDISPSMREGSFPSSVDLADSSTWGMASKRYTTSDRVDANFAGEGVWEYAAPGLGSIDELLGSAVGAAHVASYMPQGGAFGSRARAIGGTETAFEITSPGDDVVGFSFELQSSLGAVPNARVLIPLTGTLGITVAGNGTALDDLGAVTPPTTKGIGAAIHIINKGGSAGNITAKVQHSPDNSIWTDIINFAAKTLIHQSEYAEAAGTIQRYLRVIWTLTAGSTWDISVVAGRK